MANLNKVPDKNLTDAAPQKTIEDVTVDAKNDVVKFAEYEASITRDYDGAVDPFYLSKKDPEFQYRFLRDDLKNLSLKRGNLLLQKGGWQIVPREHLKRIGIKDEEISPDGMLRRGDTILAFIPKKLYEEKVEYKKELANASINAIKRTIKSGDPDVGKEIHPTLKGLQTQEQLRMK